MFKPDNSTITQYMHMVSLQNYATGLPHQETEITGPRPPTTPTQSQACGLGRFSKSGQNWAFCEGKRKSSDSLEGMCMKQVPGGGWRPCKWCFARRYTTASMSPLRCRPTTHHHLPYFLAMPKIPILNGNFSKKLRRSWAMPKDVICNYRVKETVTSCAKAMPVMYEYCYHHVICDQC